MIISLVQYRPATRADIEARYPQVPLDAQAAIKALRAYFVEMENRVPEECQGKADPVGAYRVAGAVVYHFELEETLGEVTGYVLTGGELKVPVAVRNGNVQSALWRVRTLLEW